jgi:integrase
MAKSKKSAAAGRTRVGANLYRQVTAAGTAAWVLRYQIRGKKRWMGLGPTAVYSQKEATARARAAQQQIYDGVDPLDARRQTRASEARKALLTITFEAAASAYYDQHAPKWGAKSKTAFLDTLRDHVYPVFGQLPVDTIDTALVMRAIEPIWLGKHVTAGRVRGRVEAVLAWATVRGFRSGDNPARWENHLDQLLPVGGAIDKVVHHAAMPYAAVPSFVAALRRRQGIAPRALEFLILTAARTGEILKATWGEVDFEAKIWTRPPSHMKGGIEHAVPLAPRAIAILKGLSRGSDNDLIFGAGGRPLGKNAMPKLLVALGADVTIHGFRSSFRDWCGETTAFPRELAEHALAHAVGNAVENAYARGKLLEKRRRLMAEWEKFVAMPAMAPGATVTPIRKGAK